MLSNRVANQLRLFIVWLLVWFAASSITRADVFRWDNGQVIPGTEGITPGPGVQLNDRQLEYADLRLNLSSANFRRSNLTRASFNFSRLTGTNFEGAIVAGAGLSSSSFTKEQLYSTASYQQKDLQGIGLGSPGYVFATPLPGNDLTGWDLSGQDLMNSNFSFSKLTNANLAGANLTNVNLRASTLSGASFEWAIVAGAGFSSSGFTKEQLYSTASYHQKNLQGIAFNSNLPFCCCGPFDLNGWDLSGQDLTNANFWGATLTNANLAGSILTGAGFRNSRLAGANITNAELSLSTLTSADLTAADLRGASGGNVTGAFLRNAIRPDGTVLGLDLAGGDELVVRDEDGVPDRPPPELYYSPAPRSPIPITVHDQFAMSGGGVLRLVFESDSWDSLISFQAGIPVQLGGTLELTFADDVKLATQVGRTLRIFDWTGVTPTGTFAIASPYAWDLSRLYKTGEVTLLAIPEPTSLLLVLMAAAVAATRQASRCVKTH